MSEDEERYLAELARLRVGEVLAGTVSTLVQLGLARTGLVPELAEQVDLAEARLAIEAIAALGPLLEGVLPPAATGEVKAALAQLQMAYAQAARAAGQAPPAPASGPPPDAGPPPPRPRPAPRAPERPKIWTPRGDV